jgi:hypothetical protein
MQLYSLQINKEPKIKPIKFFGGANMSLHMAHTMNYNNK